MAKRAFVHRWSWLLAGALFALAGAALADPNWRENGNSRAAVEGGQCVRPTDWMRRNHMDLIKHDRTVTVHQGVRTVDGSLAACVECHANKDPQGQPVPIDAPGEFCAGCHEFTGTTMDCFSCHATVPAH
jgi:hypothetical protein